MATVSQDNLVSFAQPPLSQRRFPASWLGGHVEGDDCPKCHAAHGAHDEGARPFLYHEDEPTFPARCNVCDTWQQVGVSFFRQIVQCFNCSNKFDTSVAPA